MFDSRKLWKKQTFKYPAATLAVACLAFNSAVTCAGAGVVVTAEKLLTTILELEDAATGLETTVPMDTKEQPQSEGV